MPKSTMKARNDERKYYHHCEKMEDWPKSKRSSSVFLVNNEGDKNVHVTQSNKEQTEKKCNE